MGRYIKQKSTSGASGGGKRKTPSSLCQDPPAKKQIKVKPNKDQREALLHLHQSMEISPVAPVQMKKQETSEDGFDLAKTQVIPKNIEDPSSSSDSEDQVPWNDQLEAEWKQRMKRYRETMDEDVARRNKNKKHFY